MDTSRYLLALLLSLCSIRAVANEAPPSPLSPAQAATIRKAEATGLAIYRHDHAVSVATDAALRLPAFRQDKRVRGWVTESHGDGILVTFVDQTPAALYRVLVSRDGKAVAATRLPSPQPLSAYEMGAVVARVAALKARMRPCSKRYNYVVLPRKNGVPDKWVVYLLPSTRRPGVIPMGGTYRIDVDGTAISSQRTFTHSCVRLTLEPHQSGTMISHLMDPTPTEAHVLWNLQSRITLYVVTTQNGDLWRIENGHIRLMKDGQATTRKSGHLH